MKQLTQNERVPVGGPDRQAVVVDVRWSSSGAPAGVYVFLLDAGAKLPSRQHVMYARLTTSPDGSTVLREVQSGDLARGQVQVHLAGTDPAVHRLRIILAVNQPNATLENLAEVTASLWDPGTGEVDGAYQVTADGQSKCLILGDLRRGAGGWEFEATGTEFAGSIADLANRVGLAPASGP